jgi:hypothetical protein
MRRDAEPLSDVREDYKCGVPLIEVFHDQPPNRPYNGLSNVLGMGRSFLLSRP